MKRKLLFSLILTAILFITANVCAESVTKMHYVFLDWSGEYTGQVDTNNIPFGFGLFESEKPLEGELWHYLGSWDSGLPDGEGAVYFENGNMQKGTFSKGELADGLKYTVSGLAVVPVTAEISSADEIEAAYIGNKKSLRFHVPTCRAVSQMKEKNKVEFASREDAIDRWYIPCGDCNP